MSSEVSRELQFLNETQYWRYGPCFEVRFYFQKERCSPTDFEKTLLADSMVSAPPHIAFSMSDMPGRCVLATGNGQEPLGFIYWGGDRGDYDYYYIATYPLQIERHCGEFHWNGNADNPQKVVNFHIELVPFIHRLHSQLNFHLAFVSDEGAPWFMPKHTELNGILIYHWLVQQGDFGSSEFVEYCYALLPFY